MQPHRRQPTRLLRPWDSPGENTRVGCHFLLQCMKVKSESEVAQSCLTLRDPMDCSLPGSSAHGILQVRVLEWGAIAFSVRATPRQFMHSPVLLTSLLCLHPSCLERWGDVGGGNRIWLRTELYCLIATASLKLSWIITSDSWQHNFLTSQELIYLS